MSPNPRYPNGELKTPSRIDRENRQDILKQIVKHNKDHREAPLYIGNPTASTFKELGRIQMRDEGRNKYPIIPPWEEGEEKNISMQVAKKALALKNSATAGRRPHSALGAKAQPVVKREDQTKRHSMQDSKEGARNSQGERTSEAPRAVYDAMWATQRAATPTKTTQKGKQIEPPPKPKVTEPVSRPKLSTPAPVQKHDVKVTESKKRQPATPQSPAHNTAKAVESKQNPKPIINTHQAEATAKQKGVAFASTAETNTGSIKPTKSTPKRTPTPMPAIPKSNAPTTQETEKERQSERDKEIVRQYQDLQRRIQLGKEKEREREHRKRDQELEFTKQKQKVRPSTPLQQPQQNQNQTDIDTQIQDLQIRAAALAPLSPIFRMSVGQRNYGVNMTPERVKWAREYLDCFNRDGGVWRDQLGRTARVIFPGGWGLRERVGVGKVRDGRKDIEDKDNYTGLLDMVIRSLPPED